MRRQKHIFFIFCILFVSSTAFAKLGPPMSKDKVIAAAEFIAIIQITYVEPTKAEGGIFTYSQVASAIVERRIKGELPASIKIYGGEDFPCAQVKFVPGRYLVFLNTDNQLLRATEWQRSIHLIERDVVEWYPDDNNYKTKPSSLSFVLKDIENILGYSLEPKAIELKIENSQADKNLETYKTSFYLLLALFGIVTIFGLIYSMFRSVLLAEAIIYLARQIKDKFKS